MDFDSAPRYISKGDSRYNLNILKGEDNYYGEITNLKGNRKVTYELGDSNAYFVAWSCYDPLTRNVYAYIFSMPYDVSGSGDYEYDNRFVRFNEDSEEIVTLFYDTKNYFGVDPNIRVKDSFVIGDWLFYNPQTSEPKIIDLTRIYNYTTYAAYDATLTYTYGQKVTYFGGLFLADEAVAVGEDPVNYSTKWTRIGDSYQFGTDIEFDSEFRYAFNQIKHIPVYRPICTYATDTDKNANNVRGKLFRFSHRYKYFDNSYSRYGAYSDVTLPQYDEYYNGEVPGDLDTFNCIDVKIPLHSAALIKEIEIIFQETGGDWKQAKIVNRQDITLLDQLYYTYRFYNTDSAFAQIDDDHFLEPYDDLPRMANSMEIINKNILAFGGVTEGFDNIDKNDIDVVLTPEMEAISISESQQVGGRRRDNIAEGDWVLTPTSNGWQLTLTPNSWFTGGGWAANDVYVLTFNGKSVTYTLQAADVLNLAAFCSAIGGVFTTNFPTVRSGFGTTTVYLLSEDLNGVQTPLNISVSTLYEPSGVSEVSLTKATGFKTGAWHPFCIFYYDEAMRRWDAQTSKDHPDGVVPWSADGTTVYIPMFGEYSPNDGLLNHRWIINWSVNHLPPTGAKWWRWGYAGNALCSQFVQYIVEKIQDESPWTKLDITPLQTLKTTTEGTWNQFPQSIIEPYQWQKGDRVRIITQAASPADIGAVIDGIYDYEILKYDDTTVEGEYWIYVQDFDFAAIGAGVQTLVEIYTPIKTDVARDFYEFGELMPIIRDSDNVLVHGCGAIGTQNQDTATGDPVLGVFTAGDVYHILRTPSYAIDTVEGYFHESQWYSDFYHSDDWDKGRPGVETNFGERYLNIVRHSKQYLQNTLINGLSTFWGDTDYKELNDVFGDILRIIENGDTLKVYQRKKPSSILIGRTEYVDAEGNANIVQTSERILGAIRYSTTNYGTEFPESITRNNRYVYGFDIYNGVMWRDSANGIFPISGKYESADGGNYKMETYFKQKAKDLLVSGINGVDVETVWDERHKNLYVIFKDLVTEENNEAIMFHEPSNRWICFTNMDQTPIDGWTQMIELEWSVLRGFDGGIGYEFDLDTRFATFNIVTPHDELALLAKQDMSMTLYDPAIVIDSTHSADLNNITLFLPPPNVFISYVVIATGNLTWAWNQTGTDVKQPGVFTCSPSTAIITSKPTWIGVQSSITGQTLSVNSIIGNGDELYLYPTEINNFDNRTDYLIITNEYGNSDSITLTQTKDPTPITQPTVVVGTPGISTVLTVVDNGCSTGIGSSSLTILFTPTHPDYASGASYDINYTVYNNSNYVTAGTIPSTSISNTFLCAYSISISPSVAGSGDAFSVWLSAPRKAVEPVNSSYSASLLTSSMTIYDPTIFLTTILYSDDDLDWLSAEFGIANAKTTVVTCGDAQYTELLSAPSWIAILNSSGDSLRDDGVYVADGETLTLYPDSTVANSGPELSGIPVILINENGDTNTIIVSWGAGATAVQPTLEISYNDVIDLEFRAYDFPADRSAWVNIGSNVVYLYTGFWSPWYSGTGTVFDVYWRAYKKDSYGSYTIAMGGGGASAKISVVSNQLISAQIYFDSVVLAADDIVIYFAGNQL